MLRLKFFKDINLKWNGDFKFQTFQRRDFFISQRTM